MCVTAPVATISSRRRYALWRPTILTWRPGPVNGYTTTSISCVTIAASFKKMALIQRKLPTGVGSRMHLMNILVLNAGSSSQKSRLYAVDGSLPDEPPVPLWEADADWTGHQGTADIEISTASGQTRHESLPAGARESIIKHMLESIWSGTTKVIDQPTEIDDFSCPTPDGYQHVLDDTFSGTCRQAFMPGLTASRANLNVCGSLMSGPISISFPQWHRWFVWQRAIYCVQAALLAA